MVRKIHAIPPKTLYMYPSSGLLTSNVGRVQKLHATLLKHKIWYPYSELLALKVSRVLKLHAYPPRTTRALEADF